MTEIDKISLNQKLELIQSELEYNYLIYFKYNLMSMII